MRGGKITTLLVATALLFSACGSGSSGATGPGTVSTSARAIRASAAATPPAEGGPLTSWTEFGLDPQRSDATDRPTGITAADIGRLKDRQIKLPGTIDSSPIYLHGATVGGAGHDVVIATSSYGRTFAIDADSGKRLWTYTPPGYAALVGSAQITNSSPISEPDGRFVFTPSPDGEIHKLATASGHEVHSGAWPAVITRDPTKEKVGSALNMVGADVIATTSGYIGDAPTYQGHVVLISRETGKIDAVFNSLCTGRRAIIVPTSCPESDSAILSRGGAVVEPGNKRLLFDTGNATWDGRRYLGDSAVELTVPDLGLRQAYTPRNQAELNEEDLDLGSSAPALLGEDRVLVVGKDGVMRVLALSRLDGHRPGRREVLGGEVQTLQTPGRHPALHPACRLAPRRPDDGLHRRRQRHRRLRPARRQAPQAVGEQHPRDEPDHGRRAALRLRTRGRRDRGLRTRLLEPDRQAARRARPLEQPDRRRRPRDRARGQRQRPLGRRHDRHPHAPWMTGRPARATCE